MLFSSGKLREAPPSAGEERSGAGRSCGIPGECLKRKRHLSYLPSTHGGDFRENTLLRVLLLLTRSTTRSSVLGPEGSYPKELKMSFLWTFLLLGSLPLAATSCPELCRCAEDIVDCMSTEANEDTIPSSFAPSTRKIYLNNNELTFIPSGLFDNLKNLQEVHLWGNPWECDCHILYLRSWLQWQQNRTLYRNLQCASPSHLQGRIIAYLMEDEIIATCQYQYCRLALFSQICLFLFLLVQAVLLILVLVYMRRFRKIAKEASGATHEIYKHGDPWGTARKGGR
ncbi:platelet glycoprotein Ib beta chain [Pogona vitticeps]